MKNTRDNQFDELLRQKMRGMEVTPPPYAIPVTQRSRFPKKRVFLKVASLAFFTLLPLFQESDHNLLSPSFTAPVTQQESINSPKPEAIPSAASNLMAVVPIASKNKLSHLSERPVGENEARPSTLENDVDNQQGEPIKSERIHVERVHAERIHAETIKVESHAGSSPSIPAFAASGSGIPTTPPISVSGLELAGSQHVARLSPYLVEAENEHWPNAQPEYAQTTSSAYVKATDNTQSRYSIKLAFIGSHSLYGLSWIINQNNYGLYESKLANSSSGISGRYGTQMGFQLRPGLRVVFGANYLATHTHSYFMRIRNRAVEQETRLLYHQLPIILQKDQPAAFKSLPKLSGQWEAGMQYARLLSAKIGFGNSDAPAYVRFKKHEVSLLLGYSVEYRVSPRISASLGLRGRIGTGINSENWLVSGRYQQSHNANISASVGLRYWFIPQ